MPFQELSAMSSMLMTPLLELRCDLAHQLVNAQGLAGWIGDLHAAMRIQGIHGSSSERSATLSAMQQARPGCYVYATHRSGCSRHLTWSDTRVSSSTTLLGSEPPLI